METNTTINLEILKIAKELVENQYLDYRAKVHNTWLTESEKMWETKQIRLDYPTINPYPTEEEIVAKAQVLRNFLSGSINSPNVVSSTDTVTSANVSVESTTVEDTTASQPKQTKKSKIPLPPEDNTLEWARVKVNRQESHNDTSSGKVIEELLKTINN